MPGIIIYRIADGKIVEHWMQVDSAVLMQQLGVQSNGASPNLTGLRYWSGRSAVRPSTGMRPGHRSSTSMCDRPDGSAFLWPELAFP